MFYKHPHQYLFRAFFTSILNIICSEHVSKTSSTLSVQGIKRLYSTKDIDRKKELRKLNHSILVSFLDLIDVLIKYVSKEKEKEKCSSSTSAKTGSLLTL